MPELPEVETITTKLRRGSDEAPPLPGQSILKVQLKYERHIVTPSRSTFRRRIQGQTILGVTRRGKYLIFPLDNETLLIHLMMSGDLGLFPSDSKLHPHDRTIFVLDSGWSMRFNDARKFGKVYLLKDPEQVLAELGPEPLSETFNTTELGNRIKMRKRPLKSLLLDQTFLAGIGNIYADEALHRAQLHPLRRSDSLGCEEIERLWFSIRETLNEGIRHNGASIDWVYRGGEFQNHFLVYGREGQACHDCDTPIQRILVLQRSTHYCPSCQPEVDE